MLIGDTAKKMLKLKNGYRYISETELKKGTVITLRFPEDSIPESVRITDYCKGNTIYDRGSEVFNYILKCRGRHTVHFSGHNAVKFRISSRLNDAWLMSGMVYYGCFFLAECKYADGNRRAFLFMACAYASESP
ncbi:MAG: hypothetical protein LBJ12_02135 [Oscillospiraceae bacterium]|nr:hypothetical protein [Oscillospiraceae bacterium]